MLIFPAIDLFGGKAVRLLRGDYAQMTVYSEHPEEIAKDFARAGAKWIHLVDLEGAKTGETPNLETIRKIVAESGLCAEVGGGIRNMQTVKAYLEAGVQRVILGTAAVTNEAFLKEALAAYGEKIAVGVDIKDQVVKKGKAPLFLLQSSLLQQELPPPFPRQVFLREVFPLQAFVLPVVLSELEALPASWHSLLFQPRSFSSLRPFPPFVPFYICGTG